MHRTRLQEDNLVRHWWAVLLRGAVSLLFGLTTLLVPGLSLAALVLVFGVYALADGAFAVAAALRRSMAETRWAHVLEGTLQIVAGLASLRWPSALVLSISYLIAAWAMVIGVLRISSAIRLRKVITGEWLLGLTGLGTIALGPLFLSFPAAGAIAVGLWVGAYALVMGIALMALGWRLRSWGSQEATPYPVGDGAPARRLEPYRHVPVTFLPAAKRGRPSLCRRFFDETRLS
jgi:uncharacterized membrane protein HdeD (DUF308 family)